MMLLFAVIIRIEGILAFLKSAYPFFYLNNNSQLKDLLAQSGFHASDRELSYIVERYDKNRDGRLTFSEFTQEITPKAPRKIDTEA